MNTFVTAEIGTNWNGDIFKLRRMVHECKYAGCDAVKFQVLSDEKIARHPELSWYCNASVHKYNVDDIADICWREDIQWYASIYYPKAIKELKLEKYCDYVKVSVGSNQDKDILSACAQSKLKTIVSSTRPFSGDCINLYCIPQYPTMYGEINYDMVKQFDGYSNHCLNPLATLNMVRRGAKYIEFHVTEDRDTFAVDNKCAYTMQEMKDLMYWVRNV